MVQTSDKDEIQLDAVGISSEGQENIEATVSGNKLTVRYNQSEFDSDEVSFNFIVPTKLNFDLKTNSGDIKFKDNIDGNIFADTYGGDILTKNVSGNLKAETKGGDIVLGDICGDSELVTSGGDVIAANVIGNIRMETYGGDLKLDGAKGSVRAKTSGGNIEMKNIEGSVDIKTMSGSISIELNPARNSTSRISTNAGSIELTVPSFAKTTIDEITIRKSK